MHIIRLRLTGFKSFVEPTELLIEKGLTGVVGPNGCGKSNLLEALRWVMGETSYKSMRASAMDDVIFSGTNNRPPRNMAEVTIYVDNSDRLAPAEFNDSDHIEITRRIERDTGSAYRINNRETRARDVKILFEDAATGARSPALVRQGQIGEIVNAKPEQRRRILEDAAGTAGLHSRRHDADLRLKSAEANLLRLGDVIGQLKSQMDGLKRQARQARRYSELSDSIRKAEALQHYLSWTQQQRQVDREEASLRAALERLGAVTANESKAVRLEFQITETLQPLRDQEMTRAAVLARLQHAQNSLESELQLAQQRQHELQARETQLKLDLKRESELFEEAKQYCQRLEADRHALEAQHDDNGGNEEQLNRDVFESEKVLAEREAIAAELTKQHSEMQAERRAMQSRLKERIGQRTRLQQEKQQLLSDTNKVSAAAPNAEKLMLMQQEAAALKVTIDDLEEQTAEAGQSTVEAQNELEAAEIAREATHVEMREIETERRTLAQLFADTTTAVPALVDQLVVRKGYEVALGAALGDDLEAPVAVEGSVHWRQHHGISPAPVSAEMPDGVVPLTSQVSGPPELAWRLAHIGLVDAKDGAAKQLQLRPGQRIVSLQGDLWRWDGLVAPADSPSPAAKRLAARNRLKELVNRETEAHAAAEKAQAVSEAARTKLQTAQRQERTLSQQRRDCLSRLATMSKTLEGLERAARESDAKLATLRDREARTTEALQEVEKAICAAESEIGSLPLEDHLDTSMQQARLAATEQRDAVGALKAKLAATVRERARRTEQMKRLATDLVRWHERADKTEIQITTLEQRLSETRKELKEVENLPHGLEQKRQKLLHELVQAEAGRQTAADKLAEAEAALKAASQSLRSAQTSVTEQREVRVRAEVRLEAARGRRAEIVKAIEEKFAMTPEQALSLSGYNKTDDLLPELTDTETRLTRLRTDRDRLGGVNLQASEELASINEQYQTLDRERADIEEAIVKLRAGIANLNREGRKRLQEAFDVVDGHFQDLFTTLFGGGEAKLEMIDDDGDPLAGGLEIIARPPGKKPTALSLLSGGEQTLTALSLIFAVFLTNPSPICVLDEVDAPLDDANVDRFCTLMEKMAADTDTRFLVITHHPMTMARMDRLFGVTMVERGVSQLVSVDLAAAEGILETAS
ncbi:MAG: chromosome segregation protein SMC [Pseudomonadota bacterium]